MGEYLQFNGDTFKLGTCEDLYYVTFDRLVEIVPRASKLPGNAAPAEYLGAGWRYRFPFPDEFTDADRERDFERSLNVWVQAESLKQTIAAFEHYSVQVTIPPKGGLPQFSGATLNSPCPQSKAWAGHRRCDNLLGICQQKSTLEADRPQLWLVVGCPFCGAKSRLNEAEATILAEEFNSRQDADQQGIAALILAGYAPGNAFEVHGNYDRRSTEVAG